jgi:hypothetical protein
MYYIEDKEILIIGPRRYGLSQRTAIGQLSQNHFIIIKDRKSRIIMKDGNKILEQVNLIQHKEQKAKISLATNAPICSKTTVFLREHGIDILALDKQL